MNSTPSPTRTTTRRAVVATAAAALALTLAPVGAQAAAPATAPAATTTAALTTTTAPGASLAGPRAAAPLLRDTHYLAATHTGTTARLQLVDRATGAVARTVITRPMLRGGAGSPFRDARIARDGSVWYVATDGTYWGSTLVHVVNGRPQAFMPYVARFALSPDGTKVAMSVYSPDVDHDGYATVTVRAGATSGRGGFTVLATRRVPVGRDGRPTLNDAGPFLESWLGSTHLLVSRGCCGGNELSVIRADRAVPESTWPVLQDADPIGVYPDGSALVAELDTLGGHRLRHVTVAAPRGTVVATVKGRTWQEDRDIVRRVAAAQHVTLTTDFYGSVRAPKGGADAIFLGR